VKIPPRARQGELLCAAVGTDRAAEYTERMLIYGRTTCGPAADLGRALHRAPAASAPGISGPPHCGEPAVVPSAASVERRKVPGGLINKYYRAA
jgi:hypothetical protein